MENISKTKQKVIDIALKSFKERGYKSLTIDEICKIAGISKNTYYYHFESKESLLIACMREQKAMSLKKFSSILLSESNHFEQFWLLQKERLDTITSCSVEMLRNLSVKSMQNADYMVSNKIELLDIEIGIIENAQKAKEIRNQADPRNLTISASAQFFGLLGLWISMDGRFDLEKVLRSSLESILDVPPAACRGGDLGKQLLAAIMK